MKKVAFGLLLCFLLCLVLIVTSAIGGGIIIASLFNIPNCIGALIFLVVFTLLAIIGVYFIAGE